MNSKISGIIDYISMLVKKYSELQRMQMNNTFRVASIKQTAKGTKIIFQVIGKSTFMECSPAEILSNDAFIEKFSKQDVKKITLANAEDEKIKKLKVPDIKVIQHEFNQTAGKTQLTLRNKEGNISTKTAGEIVIDKETIKKLGQEDAINIDYIAGYEHSQTDSYTDSK